MTDAHHRTPPPTRWEQLTGGAGGAEYAARFEALARSGKDVHGEASFCEVLLAPLGRPGRVLDAGCGTGRVAVRLAERGHRLVGVDVDASMLAVAETLAADVAWVRGDLAALPAAVRDAGPYDLVLLAGNVVPLLAEGTLAGTVGGLAAVLAPGGLLVAGFGLDRAHLPPGCPVTPLADHDTACAAAGLVLRERFATWAGAPYVEGGGYAVSVHEAAAG